jgi:hypothetical protein
MMHQNKTLLKNKKIKTFMVHNRPLKSDYNENIINIMILKMTQNMTLKFEKGRKYICGTQHRSPPHPYTTARTHTQYHEAQ